jgi:hypothetical protein
MKDIIEVMVMTNWGSVSLNPSAQVNKADHLHFQTVATCSQPTCFKVIQPASYAATLFLIPDIVPHAMQKQVLTL